MCLRVCARFFERARVPVPQQVIGRQLLGAGLGWRRGGGVFLVPLGEGGSLCLERCPAARLVLPGPEAQGLAVGRREDRGGGGGRGGGGLGAGVERGRLRGRERVGS